MRTLLFVLWLSILPFPQAAYAQSDGQQYREVAERRLDELGGPKMPGIAYAVVEQGEISEVGAWGVKRLGGDEPIGPDTPFMIGSISKSFTAIGVLQLVEAGQVSLDGPISRYLPSFSDKPSGAITIRQLLSHTSGYSTYQGHFPRATDRAPMGPIERGANQLATTAPAYEPGGRWAYSNANYLILGRLIEVVSGQDYPTYIERNILEPAGMVHSFVSDGERHAAMATGHPPWFGSKHPLLENRTDLGSAPQGGIVASASDLGRYMLLLMNGEDDIISAETKAAMMKPASETSPFYGLGWFLDREDGTVSHSGESPGVETVLTMMPAERKGVVVLVNAGSGIGFGSTSTLRNGITAGALGLDYTGEGSRLVPKATFIAMSLLPIVYLLSMVWAWRYRSAVRAKSGPTGLFSLWFPLLTTSLVAWGTLFLVPRLSGLPLDTLSLYLPDFWLGLISTAATGVLWAVFRLGVAYTGDREQEGRPALLDRHR